MAILVGLHLIISIISFIVSNSYEKSIITDKVNKYIFVGISLLYSIIAPYIIVGSLLMIEQLTAAAYRLMISGMLLLFLFIQVLVYKCLNTFEAE